MDLKIHRFVIVFMAFWLGGVGLGLVGTIYGILRQETNPLFAVVPLVMLAFGIGLAFFGFNSEKEKSIAKIKQMVAGKTRNNKFTNRVDT